MGETVSLLDVVGVRSSGTEVLFDRRRMEPGVHLRWSFQREAGFPSRVTIYRKLRPFELGFWAATWGPAIATITPLSPGGLEARRAALLDGEFLVHHQAGLASAEAALARLAEGGDLPPHRIPLAEPRRDGHITAGVSLGALDSLLIAAADPHFARIIGLAHCDGTVPTWIDAAYKVVAEWGASWSPDVLRIRFDAALDAARARLMIHDVALSSNGAISLVPMAGDRFVSARIRRRGALELRLTLARPIRRVKLGLALTGASDVSWSARGVLSTGATTSLGVSVVEGGVEIAASGGDQLTELAIVVSPAGWPASGFGVVVEVTLTSISSWERSGPIGAASAVAIFGARRAGEDDRDVDASLSGSPILRFLDASPVPAPRLHRPRPVRAPRLLGHDGRGPRGGADVVLPYSVDSGAGPHDIVGIHVLRASGGPFPLPLVQSLMRRGPDPSPAHRLLADWPLNGTAIDSVRDVAAVYQGPGAGPTYASLDSSAPERRCLVLSGTGRLEIAAPSSLASIAQSLEVDAWISPAAGHAASTIVGNNGAQSFSLGLSPGSDSSHYQVRLRINGQTFSATSQVSTAWTHVCASYDGERVRFRIGGEPAGSFPAMLGSIGVNPDRVLCIGADRDGAAVLDGYHGRLADVRIWAQERSSPSGSTRGLAASFAFDGSWIDATFGATATPTGSARFVQGHPERASRRALEIGPGDFAELRAGEDLLALREQFTLEAWICPAEDGPALLLSDGASRGLRWTLGGSPRRQQLSLRGTTFSAKASVPRDAWTHLAVSHDGTEVRFYHNGRLDVVRSAEGRSLHPGSRWLLCADPASPSTPPFRGLLADLRVWSLVPSPPTPVRVHRSDRLACFRLTGSFVDDVWGVMPALRGGVTLEAPHPDDASLRAAAFDGTGYLEVTDLPDLGVLDGAFTLDARVRPTVRVGATAGTILGEAAPDDAALLWFGVTSAGRLSLRINGRSFTTAATVRQGKWTRVSASYDTSQVVLRVAGSEERFGATGTGPLLARATATWYIGGVPRAGAIVDSPFFGAMTDVRVWRSALSSDAQRLRAPRPAAPTQAIDRGVPDGEHRYELQGIDLFGRLSAGRGVADVDVKDDSPPPPPGDVRAAFSKYSGTIQPMDASRLRAGEAPVPDGGQWIYTDIEAPLDVLAELGATSGPGRPRGGHEARVLRGAGLERRSQVFEIRRAVCDGGGRLLLLIDSALRLPALLPRAGDDVSIALDHRVRVEWTWSGRQRVLWPEVRELRVYAAVGSSDERPGVDQAMEASAASWPERVAVVPSASAGESADFEIDEATTIPDISGSQREQLVLEGAVGLPQRDDSSSASPGSPPEPAQSRLHLITLEGWHGAMDDGGDPARGALVARNCSVDPPVWQIFDVVWGRPSPIGVELFLWVDAPRFEGDGASAAPEGADPGAGAATPLVLRDLRYYGGRRQEVYVDLAISYPPGTGTLPVKLAVTAADQNPRIPDSRPGGGRPGKEGPTSRVASLVAVDRRRPPRPPAPEVAICRADFHGQSKAEVSWPATPGGDERGIRWQVARTTDTALFASDTDLRRRRVGIYLEEGSFHDDPDFDDWLAMCFLHGTALTAAGLMADLFTPKPGKEPPKTSTVAHASWKAAVTKRSRATEIWSAWAARFYPTRTASELRALADLAGNDAAFSVVGVAEIPPGGALDGAHRHLDRVPGNVRNRYLYRLRTLRPSLQPGEWGPVSTPERAPYAVRPRAPRFTAVTPGDRSIQLSWTLSPDPSVTHYRVYRGTSAESLEDLRFEHPDRTLVAEVPDPRLRIRNGELRMPPVTGTVIGVYRAEEYSTAELEARKARRAFTPDEAGLYNLAPPGMATTAGADHTVLAPLRRVEDGTAVVVVTQVAGGARNAVASSISSDLLVDRGLVGLSAHHYSVVAICRGAGPDCLSPPSAVVRARPAEIEPPPAPLCEISRTSASEEEDDIRIRVASSGVSGDQMLVQRYDPWSETWRALEPWSALSDGAELNDRARKQDHVRYRAWVRSASHRPCVSATEYMVESLPGRAEVPE